MTGLVLGVLAGLLIATLISVLSIQNAGGALPGSVDALIVLVVAVIGVKAGGSTDDR